MISIDTCISMKEGMKDLLFANITTFFLALLYQTSWINIAEWRKVWTMSHDIVQGPLDVFMRYD